VESRIHLENSMHHLFAMLRLMTHVNIGATIALVAWLVTQSYVPDGTSPPGTAQAQPAAKTSTGAAQ
jgi:hypothetical protein